MSGVFRKSVHLVEYQTVRSKLMKFYKTNNKGCSATIYLKSDSESETRDDPFWTLHNSSQSDKE